MISVLYVDDERAFLDLGKIFLERNGELFLESAQSGKEALEKLRSNSYDAIVSDYQMPELDGIELLKEVRQSYDYIPFILFTGKGREEIVIEAINHGADFYLQKGGSPTAQFAELEHQIKKAVERKRAQDALEESEEKFRSLVENSLEGIIIIDMAGKILFLNRAVGVIIGGTQYKDLVGNCNILSFLHPQSYPAAIRDLVKVAAGTDTYLVTYRAKIPSGEDKWIECIGKKITYGRSPAILLSLREITDKKHTEDRLSRINETLLNLGRDHQENISVLTNLTGELLKADCVLYNRLHERLLCTLAHWNAPPDLKTQDTPEGHICFDVIRGKGSGPLVVLNLQKSNYAKTDPNVAAYGLKTYIGHPVSYGGITRGSLCAVYTHDIKPTPQDMRIIGILSTAIAQEEERSESENALDSLVLETTGVRGQEFFNAAVRWVCNYTGADIAMISELGPDNIARPLAMVSDGQPVSEYEYLLEGTPCEDIFHKGFCHYPDNVAALFPRAADLVKFDVRGYAGIPMLNKEGSVVGVICVLSHGELNLPPLTNTIMDLLSLRTSAELERWRFEQEMQQSEEKYRELAELLPQIVFETDTDLNVTYGNRIALTSLGATPEDLACGINSLSFIEPSQHSYLLENIKKIVEGRPRESHEYTAVRKDGSTFPVIINAAPMYKDGKLTGFRGVVTDITQIRNAEVNLRSAYDKLSDTEEKLRQQFEELARKEQDLRESEQRFSLFMNHLPAAAFIKNANGLLIFGNSYLSDIFGWEASTGKSTYDLLPREVAEAMVKDDKRALAEGTLTTLENITDTKGRERLFRTSKFAIPGTEGENLLAGISIDITELKHAEDALRESEEKYRTIFENMQDMFYRADLEGRLTMISPKAPLIAGYTDPWALIGIDIAEAIYVNPADRGKLLETLARDGLVTGYPIVLKAGDGTPRFFLGNSQFYHDSNGKVLGIEGVLHDVTDLKRVEDALRQVNRQLNLLTAITRHDILNKIMVLVGSLEIAHQISSDPQVNAYLKKMDSAVREIQSQIEFTGVYQDLGIQEPRWQDLHEIISRLEVPSQITLNVELDGEEIFADFMLEKVFYNLLDNTVRHCPNGSAIKLSSLESSGTLTILWEDDGIGISPEEKEKIFERGYGKNSGFGLFLAREILSITGITINETGEPGKEARFEILVPPGLYRK